MQPSEGGNEVEKGVGDCSKAMVWIAGSRVRIPNFDVDVSRGQSLESNTELVQCLKCKMISGGLTWSGDKAH